MDGIAPPGLQEPHDAFIHVNERRAKARLPIELSHETPADITGAKMYCLTVQTSNPL